MQIITTKILTITNTKPLRIKAVSSGGVSIVISRSEDSTNLEGDHMKAAKALKDKLKWPGKMHGGHTADGGMVFVFPDKHYVIE